MTPRESTANREMRPACGRLAAAPRPSLVVPSYLVSVPVRCPVRQPAGLRGGGGWWRHTRRGRRATAGFTLLEILLAIAIIALLGSVLIGGAGHLLTEQPVTLDEVFWKSVQEARKRALKAEHEMRLKFDGQKKQFVLLDGIAPSGVSADGFTLEDAPLQVFPVPPTAAADLTVDFLAANQSGNMVLIGGMLLESQPISYVTFYPDGTCTPFRVQFAGGGGTHTLAVDPWTCAPVLTPAADAR